MKNYKNLNEQISRIKSLFGDSNLYGNLISENNIKNTLLVEQGIGKRLAKTLAGGSDEIASSLAKALRSVDPTRATKFVNTEIDSFESFLRHIDDYADIWKTIIPDQTEFDNVVETITAFKNITKDPAKLKKLRDEIAAGNITKKQFLQTFPSNGGVYEMFDDLWESSINGKKVEVDLDDVVIVKTGDDVVVHKVEDGKVVETQKIDDDGKMQDTEVPDAQKNVDDYYAGKTLDDGSGGKKIKDTDGVKETKEITIKDGEGKTDQFKSKILGVIDTTIDKATKKPKVLVTWDDLQTHIDKLKKEGKEVAIFFKNESGSIIKVKSLDEVEIEWGVYKNEAGEDVIYIAGIKEKPPKDVSGGTGGGTGGGTTDIQDVFTGKFFTSEYKTGSQKVGGVLRFMFPQTSQVLRIINWVGTKLSFGTIPTGAIYTKQRPSLINLALKTKPGELPKTGGFTTFTKAFEGIGRGILIEHVIIGATYVTIKEFQRGEGGEEGDILTKGREYLSSPVFAYQPITWGPRIIAKVAGIEAPDFWKTLKQDCVLKCEKEVSSSELYESECYKNCIANVDNLEKQYKSVETMALNWRNTIKEIGDLESMGDEKKKEFCNCSGNECERSIMIKQLELMKETQTTIRTKVQKLEKDNEWTIWAINQIAKRTGMAEEVDLQSMLLTIEDKDGNTVQLTDQVIDAEIQNIQNFCANVINDNNGGGDIPQVPNNTNDTIPTNNMGTTTDSLELVFNFEAIPIEIVPSVS